MKKKTVKRKYNHKKKTNRNYKKKTNRNYKKKTIRKHKRIKIKKKYSKRKQRGGSRGLSKKQKIAGLQYSIGWFGGSAGIGLGLVQLVH